MGMEGRGLLWWMRGDWWGWSEGGKVGVDREDGDLRREMEDGGRYLL